MSNIPNVDTLASGFGGSREILPLALRLPASGVRPEKQAKDDVAPHASQHGVGASDPVTPAAIGAAETGHAHGSVHEEFIYPSQDAHDAILDDWPHNTAGAADEVAFIWHVPADWINIRSICVVMIPDATETIQADIDVSVAAAGEDYNADTRQSLDQTLDVTVNDITEWDISSIDTLFEDISINDYVAIRFQSDTDTLRILGLRVNYEAAG